MLKEHEAGAKVDDICRRHAISTATFYTWRKKYGGIEASDAKRLWCCPRLTGHLGGLMGASELARRAHP